MENKDRPVIGVLLSMMEQGYSSSITRGILRAARKKGIGLRFFIGGELQSYCLSNPDKDLIYFFAGQENIRGLIIISGNLAHGFTEDQINDYLKKIVTIPAVSVGIPVKNSSCVAIDNAAGMEQLITHLIEVHDYKKFVFIAGSKEHNESILRLQTFQEVLSRYNIPGDNVLLYYGGFDIGILRKTIPGIIAGLADRIKNEIDVIVCSNDFTAFLVIEELEKLGLGVPEDVAITGFDDSEVYRYNLPPLTTIKQDFAEQGEKALELVLDMIDKKSSPGTLKTQSRLVVRESCGCPSARKNKKLLVLNTSGAPEKKPLTAGELSSFLFTSLNSALSPEHIGEDEIKKVCSALVDDLLGENEENYEKSTFIKILETLLYTNTTNENTIREWQDILDSISSLVLSRCTDKNTILKYNLILKEALLSIKDMTMIVSRMAQAKEFSDMFRLKLLLNEINLSRNFENLLKSLQTTLTSVGISVFYLSLFAGGKFNYKNQAGQKKIALPPEDSLLFLGHEDGKLVIYKKPVRFKTKELLPGKLPQGKKDSSRDENVFLLYSLSNKNKHYGFIIFKYEEKARIYYDYLHDTLSSLFDSMNQYEELEESNRAKSTFFMNITHETKTPVTLIKNYLEMHMNKQKPTKELEVVYKNTLELERNMNNYLQIEKASSSENRIYEHHTICNLTEFIKNTASRYPEKMISLYLDNSVYVKANPDALKRILDNLLINAVKYNEKDVKILIRLITEGKKSILRISDNGVGIPAEQRAHIFEPFYQLSKKKKNIQGVGLGLSLVKKIVDSLDGEITCEANLDQGAAFVITFNLCSEKELKELEQAADERALTGADFETPLLSLPEKEETVSDSDYLRERKNILLVEDKKELLEMLKYTFKGDYNIFVAENGKKGVEKLAELTEKNRLPGIIISDIMMDEMDGHEFLDIISANPDLNDIPFIFLTAKATHNEKIAGLNRGALDYIFKPFSMDELKIKVKMHLQNRQRSYEKLKSKIEDNFIKRNQTKKPGEIEVNFTDMFEEKAITSGLTTREKEIVLLLLYGNEYKEVAWELKLSIDTIRYHVKNIYRKMNVRSKMEILLQFKVK